jgi:hypothetical protein
MTDSPEKRGLLERIHDRLGGTVTVPEGVDLTEPTCLDWDASNEAAILEAAKRPQVIED